MAIDKIHFNYGFEYELNDLKIPNLRIDILKKNFNDYVDNIAKNFNNTLTPDDLKKRVYSEIEKNSIFPFKTHVFRNNLLAIETEDANQFRYTYKYKYNNSIEAITFFFDKEWDTEIIYGYPSGYNTNFDHQSFDKDCENSIKLLTKICDNKHLNCDSLQKSYIPCNVSGLKGDCQICDTKFRCKTSIDVPKGKPQMTISIHIDKFPSILEKYSKVDKRKLRNSTLSFNGNLISTYKDIYDNIINVNINESIKGVLMYVFLLEFYFLDIKENLKDDEYNKMYMPIKPRTNPGFLLKKLSVSDMDILKLSNIFTFYSSIFNKYLKNPKDISTPDYCEFDETKNSPYEITVEFRNWLNLFNAVSFPLENSCKKTKIQDLDLKEFHDSAICIINGFERIIKNNEDPSYYRQQLLDEEKIKRNLAVETTKSFEKPKTRSYKKVKEDENSSKKPKNFFKPKKSISKKTKKSPSKKSPSKKSPSKKSMSKKSMSKKSMSKKSMSKKSMSKKSMSKKSMSKKSMSTRIIKL